MKFADIKIEAGCYFETDVGTFDLHNDWDLEGITYEQESTKVILRWIPSGFARKNNASTEALQQIFEGVSLLRHKTPDVMSPQGEAILLNAAGRLHPEDEEVMNGFLDDEDSCRDFPMIFIFGDGSAVKVLSETVMVQHSIEQ